MLWQVHPGGHVTPIDDLREHDACEQCWCRPIEDGECLGVFVHNSMDLREQFERGERKVS